ncbi:MAG: chemotaxis-specific protein-glutamate methyltransferase CheB [Phycisphaerales bacterium]|nr:chemotaxis-specific protein-glutamate methyltransferase CheB [Phycisphaerales bacterium]
MRIAIVNDLRLAVESLRRSVALIPGASIAWIAEDGERAVAMCAADRPDLILMDMLMPVMDGVEATRRIMRSTPCPILVVTATVEGNASKVFEALGAGALDAVATPGLSPDGGVVNAEALIRKARAIALLVGSPSPKPVHAIHVPASGGRKHLQPLVAIGASTGGPQALATVLSALPTPLPWPVVVVQHIDASFAHGLSDWLASETGHRVKAIADLESPSPGVILLAKTDDHVIVDSGGLLRYVEQPRDVVYRPSVDVFFESLADVNAAPGAAILLTGMGRDGAAGMARLRASGWITIAQDKSSSVVWGMPGAAVELGAAMKTLTVQAIGSEIALAMAGQAERARRSA